MNNTGRIVTFLLIVLSVWTLMHVYVLVRLWTLPLAPGTLYHATLVAIAALLWISFPLGQIFSRAFGRASVPLEIAGSVWVGVLFLLVVWLFAADLATGFGWLLPGATRSSRAIAVGIAGGLSLVALAQGLRAPVVRSLEVPIRGLRPEHDGLVIVQVTDIHVGPLRSERWIKDRVTQIEALKPDLIAMTGDLVDHDATRSQEMVPLLRRLKAPLGVWAVTGNHEFYAGVERSLQVFRDAGFNVLRDAAAEVAPGLVLAGVDDLTARRQFSVNGHAVDRTLEGRPPGATVYLCHSPLEVERAASLGVALMLSGHTHAGQIWPFTHVVRLAYPYVAGRFAVNGMTLIVSRGTGVWGPPMRLFRPSEVLRITLRRAA